MSRIYKFEATKSRDYWIEIQEIPTSMSEYRFRNSFSKNGDWEIMTYYPGESFDSLLKVYRDNNSLYLEVIGPSDIRYPSFNDLILGVTKDKEPQKCGCDIQDLVRRGCVCGGI